MKISAISQQVKNPDRYSLYVDGSYVFSLSASALLESQLAVGTELNESQIVELKRQSGLDKLYNRLLGLIARRPRSEWELEQYLSRKDVDKNDTTILLDKLRARGYVDDHDFASRWVESRRLLKSVSKRRLTQELKMKRVSDEIIRSVLQDDETDEVGVLIDLIKKKQTQSRYQDNQKLMQYLLRQGFNYEDIKNNLKP